MASSAPTAPRRGTPAEPDANPPAGRWAWFGAGFALATSGFVVYQLFLAPQTAVRVTTPPRPVPSPVVAQVAGAVRQPGLYTLPASGRIEDAIQAAGGPADDANLDAVNLAARVSDGQRVVVPRRAQAGSAPAAGAAPLPGPDAAPAADVGPAPATAEPPLAERRVNLNTATLAELDSLPGVGPATVQKIVDQRQKAPFTSIEQLLELKIVNSATMARLRDLVTVD